MAKKKNLQPMDGDSTVLSRLERVGELLAHVEGEVLGHRVKRLRESQAFSIREVAERAGISKNSIVRLEQGRGTQAITVMKVCSVLGIHVERLAAPNSDDVVAVVHQKTDDRWFDAVNMASTPLLGKDRALTAKELKRAVDQGAHTPLNLLRCRLPGGKILPSILEIRQKSPVRSHVGEEFVYVLSGAATITVGKKKYRLKEGECVTFWSAEPHTYEPTDPKKIPARILSIRVDG